MPSVYDLKPAFQGALRPLVTAFLPVPFFCEARVGAPRRLSGTREQMLDALRQAVEELRTHPR